MTNFEWQTEEDEWPDLTVSETDTTLPKKKSWRKYLIIGVLLAVVMFLAYRAVDGQVDRREREIKADVISSHRLIRQAVNESDVSLFSSFLSGRDPQWTATQNDLVDQKLFGNLASLGLSGPSGDGVLVDVSLSPDFGTAEVVMSRLYATRSQIGTTQFFELHQTAIYRRGSDRWLLAPPGDTFWGPEATNEGEWIVISYPQRDESLAAFLLSYLELKLHTLCANASGLNCPNERPLIQLTFSTDPATLLLAADKTATLQSDLTLTLPTPSLAGIPSDETGQQALIRGYAALVLRSVITAMLNRPCCQQGLFFQAMVDYELNHLGVQEWPLAPADYASLAANRRSLFSDSGTWNTTVNGFPEGQNWQKAYAVVAFLASLNMGLPLAEMEQSLATASYRQWLEEFIPPGWTNTGAEEEWWRFVDRQSQLGQIG